MTNLAYSLPERSPRAPRETPRHVEIVSTCRAGAKIAGTNYPSRHASGQAIDFRVPGRKAEVVRWLIAHHHNGGVMTYSDMDHIHVDIGPHFVALNRPSGRT